MTRDRDIKKSDFIEVSSSQATDYLDLVRNGQNFKILQSVLVNDFGVSGPLSTLGEVTGTPVLKVISDVNYIRNLIAGSGVLLSDSPQDGIEIAHNLDVDKTGVQIMINEGAAQPTIRSIQAGTGISVAGAEGIIQIATSGSPGSTKTIQVFTEDDFPDAVLGVITLAGDTEYRLQNDVTVTSRFIMGENTVISGADRFLISLTYSGVGTMFTSIDKNIKFRDICLKCSLGTMFDVSSTTGTHVFRFLSGGVECLNVGTFTGLEVFLLRNCRFNDVAGTGFVFAGAFSVVLITISILITSGAGTTMFDLASATFGVLILDKVLFDVSSTGYCLSGLASSGNINVGGIGVLTNIFQEGSSDILNNISPYDDRWEMQFNSQIPNSLDLILATNAGTTVTIATASTPVIIGATWVAHNSYRFSGTAGGRWTYNGKGSHVALNASISVDIPTGVDEVSFFFYLNGVQEANSIITRKVDSGNVGNLSMIWELEMETGDYVEIWVQNDDTNVNVIIENAIMRIRS